MEGDIKGNLEFVRDENDTTKNIDGAMMFETKNEAFNDLYNYSDDVKNRYKVYKATREHFKSCWESAVKELQNLASYTNYLEEKLMYALGPKNKEFDDMTKYHFSNILRKSYYDNRDTYQIKKSLLEYYKNGVGGDK